MDIFKIQNVNLVQNAEALGSLKRKRRKTQTLPPIVINCQEQLKRALKNTFGSLDYRDSKKKIT